MDKKKIREILEKVQDEIILNLDDYNLIVKMDLFLSESKIFEILVADNRVLFIGIGNSTSILYNLIDNIVVDERLKELWISIKEVR